MPRHRSHVALTVLPVAVLFLYGLSRMWPALRGASSFAAASPASWLSLTATTIVALVFFGAYARGWSRFDLARGDEAGPYRTAGCLRLQKIAGSIAWGLFAFHLLAVWVMTFRAGPVALSHYELWRELLSRPVVLGVYVLGIAAVGLYLSQGVAASFRAWGLGTRPETSRWLEVGCTLASALTMLLAVNVVSHFATGRAYWSVPSSGASEHSSTGDGDARSQR